MKERLQAAYARLAYLQLMATREAWTAADWAALSNRGSKYRELS